MINNFVDDCSNGCQTTLTKEQLEKRIEAYYNRLMIAKDSDVRHTLSDEIIQLQEQHYNRFNDYYMLQTREVNLDVREDE